MKEVIYDGGELFLGLFVKVRDRDTSGEDGIVRVGDGHVRSGLCCLHKELAINARPCVWSGLPDCLALLW